MVVNKAIPPLFCLRLDRPMKSLSLIGPVDVTSYASRHLGDKPKRFGMNICGIRQFSIGLFSAPFSMLVSYLCYPPNRYINRMIIEQ